MIKKFVVRNVSIQVRHTQIYSAIDSSYNIEILDIEMIEINILFRQ